MRRTIAFSAIAELGATLSMVLTFRIANDRWGIVGFSEWILARRLLAFLLPVLTLGMDVGLPRAIAKSHIAGAEAYLLAAVAIVIATTVFSGAVLLPVDGWVARVVFGDSARSPLVAPIVLISAAYAFHILVYGYLRGRLRIMEANLAHILAFGVIPLVVLLVANSSVATAISATAAVIFLAAGVFLAVNLRFAERSGAVFREQVAELAHYGGPRMIAALLLMALSLFPASLVAFRSGIEAAGFVALAFSVVGLAGSACSPLGVVLLPLAASMWAKGRRAELLWEFRRLEKILLLLGIAAIVVIPVCAPVLAWIFLGERDPELLTALRLSGLAAAPFIYFVCARQVVDACSVDAWNTRNLLIAVASFAAAWFAFGAIGLDSIVVAMLSYACSMLVLALLTARTVRRLLKGE